jgi:hypothetical protein
MAVDIAGGIYNMTANPVGLSANINAFRDQLRAEKIYLAAQGGQHSKNERSKTFDPLVGVTEGDELPNKIVARILDLRFECHVYLHLIGH